MLMGAYLCTRFMPIPAAQIITKTDVKTKIVRVMQPNGQITETTEQQSVSVPIVKKKYGVGLYHDKTLFAEARLGNLPLFLMAETNLKEHRVGIKVEF